MRVINIDGTSAHTCGCGSWLNHWKNHSGQSLRGYCSEKTCYGKPEVGAHIQKGGAFDNSWYIVPLCKSHNATTDNALEISDTIVLVSANVNETCGK